MKEACEGACISCLRATAFGGRSVGVVQLEHEAQKRWIADSAEARSGPVRAAAHQPRCEVGRLWRLHVAPVSIAAAPLATMGAAVQATRHVGGAHSGKGEWMGRGWMDE